MIKIFSDKTGKFYNSVDEANRAEFELKEKENLARIEKERKERELKEKKEQEAAERKEAAEKVEAARKAYLEAQKAYKAELDKFIKTYGSFHMSWSANDMKSIEDLLSTFSSLFI